MGSGKIVYLSIGSNLGNRKQNIRESIQHLEHVGQIIMYSDFMNSEPMGFESDNYFLNIALKIKTELSPIILLEKLKEIELKMGRLSKNVVEDRIIDIDIVFYEDITMNEKELTIPHPNYRKRSFVLKPLHELGTVQDSSTFLLIEQLLR